MPWDGSELWVGRLDDDGSVGSTDLIAGGSTESIASPAWAPDGSLVFASDRSGWWNLYRWRPGTPGIEAMAPMEAEFAEPQWVFGQRQFGFDGRGRVIAIARVRWPRPPAGPGGRAASHARSSWMRPTCRALSVAGDTAVVVAESPDRPDRGRAHRPGARGRGAYPRGRHAAGRCRVPVAATVRGVPHRPMAAPRSRSTIRPPTRTRSPRRASCRHSWSSRTAARPRTPTRA